MRRIRGLARLIVLQGVPLAAAVVLVGCAIGSLEAEVVEDSFTVTGQPRLAVNIDNGSIEVNSSSAGGNTINVTATVRGPERVGYRVVQEGNTVKIEAEVAEGIDFPGGEDRGVDIMVSVPREIDLELAVSNGAIRVSGITGPVSAKISNGPVLISDTTGNVEVETSNGRVELTGLKGQVKAETSNGDINFSGTLPSGSENALNTSNGSVEVSLMDIPGVELDAATSNGRVGSLLPVALTGPAKENELKGTVGDGGSRLKIRASNGSISIK